MRVLTTTLCYPTPDQPDRGVFVARRAAAVSAMRDVEVDVVAPQLWMPLLRRVVNRPDACEPLAVTYPRMLSVPVLGWATDGLAYAHALSRAIQARPLEEYPDLIDAHFEYPDGVGAWLAGRHLGIPVVVTVRGKIVSLSRRAVRRLQIAAMLRGVDARIAVSDSLATWTRRIAGSDLPVDVIPNGVDAGVFHMMERAEARAKLGWHCGTRYVLAVGHQQHVKGFDRLVAVTEDVRKVAGDVCFVLVGSQRGERSFRRHLQRLVQACNTGFPDTCAPVRLHPPVSAEQLNLMYNAADLLVCPSRSEGWCNAISEALGAGTPVVATDVGGNPEQVCSGELGLIVRDGDRAAMGSAIVEALKREWNRVLISAHASARGWSNVAGDVYQVFQRVLARRAASTADHREHATPRMELQTGGAR